LSEKETAQQLGKPVSTVKSRRFSAIQQLRLALTDDYYSFERKEKKI
jgi:DNA-directed RNA polymerase specialized sigma24 family protein